MLKCDLMKNGKCVCTTKCAKLIWYEQGRADQKKEDNEFFNFESAWELEKQKIRADAIEEFADYLKKHFRIGVNTIDDVVKEYKERKK